MSRHTDRWTIPIAAVAGVAAAVAGAEPTGTGAVDIVLVVVAVGLTTWAASSAPWLAVIAVAGVAAATSLSPVVTLAGVMAFLAALLLWVRHAEAPVGRVVITAVALNVAARSELEWFFGASALIGVGAAVVLLVAGVAKRPGPSGRRVRLGLAVVGAAVALVLVGFGASVVSARQALSDGNAFARRGLDLLGEGETSAAQRAFERSAQEFEGARGRVRVPWTGLTRLVPIAAQHRESLVTLVDEATTATTNIARHLSELDLDRLRVVDGRLDLSVLNEVSTPLDGLQDTMADLRDGAQRASNPWLLAPVQRRIDALEADLDVQQERSDLAEQIVDLAPALLGGEGRRVYLVVFTTPSEARGHGGFTGNWAEVTMDDGRIEMTDFGRSRELNEGGRRRVLSGPSEWLDRYGRYGFDNHDGYVGRVPWLNITMSPHFPSTGQVMAELYPQSGGRPVDGVVALDVATMASLLDFTGPIEVARLGEVITSENAEEFLLLTQYELGGARLDLLQDVALTVVDELLGGALPGPAALGRTLGPMVAEGRLTTYSIRDEEQDLFERLGMAGALPRPDGGDALAVTFNNAAGNKIDNFLDVEIDYRVRADSESGAVHADLVLTVTNSAPTDGYPDYVIGNVVGLPVGTNQTLLTVFSALPVGSATLDGEEPPLDRSTEQGYHATMTSFVIPPDSKRVIEIELAGTLDIDEAYRLAVRMPPAVRPFDTRVTIEVDEGRPRSARLTRPGVQRLEARW